MSIYAHLYISIMFIYTSTLKYYDFLQGNIAVAVRASCTFPGMFQPVMIDGIGPCIDGGVWDHAGLMAMPYAIKVSMISSASALTATRDDHDSSSESNGMFA
jgi:predicted patatin/cPLA2 family phospholipase